MEKLTLKFGVPLHESSFKVIIFPTQRVCHGPFSVMGWAFSTNSVTANYEKRKIVHKKKQHVLENKK